MKGVFWGIVLLVATSEAYAAGYREVWNPPEARGGARHIQSAHKPVKHMRASPNLARTKARHIAEARVTMRPERASRSTSETGQSNFDDIPRRITPEGNVLRFDGGHVRAEVQR
jgi:hypothetical protein